MLHHHRFTAKPNMYFILTFLLALHPWSSAAAFPNPPPPAPPHNGSLEYMDPTLPPLLLPAQTPKCSILALQHDFGHTLGNPPLSVNYTPPPDCPAPWSRVVLELSASASNAQRDRVAAVWLDGAEILRTTTPAPMFPGVFWRVRKDVTRYTALLRAPAGNLLSLMLENSLLSLPGIYSVNVSLHFYRGVLQIPEPEPKLALPGLAVSAHPTIKGLYGEPADHIIPISVDTGDCGSGYWFRLQNESDVQLSSVVVPTNTFRAVMEVYVSAHGDDEHWYANPLRSTGDAASAKANGGFRQVVVSIDGRYAGAVVPFPVISPGSVNPYFWAPVAAIGAYDHPSYDIDLTPFVGLLIDGREHEFGLAVLDSHPYWLVSANLHLWVDAWSDGVEGALVRYKVPPLRLSRQADWKDKDGKSAVDGQVIVRFTGWVSSSKGNISTSIRQGLKFKSRVVVRGGGSTKQASMEVKTRTNVRVEKNHAVVGRVAIETDAPLEMLTVRSNGGGESVLEKTKLTHLLQQTTTVSEGKEVAFGSMTDRQESEGSALVHGGVALWGSGDTKSTYKFRDDKACYLRTVNMVGGKIQDDAESASCASLDAASY